MNWIFHSMGIVWGALCVIGWMIGVTAWVRRGMNVPRAVHVTSAILFLVGLVSILLAHLMGFHSLGYTVFAVVGFPAWAYVGWFFLGCPPTEKKNEGYDITQALSKDKK